MHPGLRLQALAPGRAELQHGIFHSLVPRLQSGNESKHIMRKTQPGKHICIMQRLSNLKWRRYKEFRLYCSDDMFAALCNKGLDCGKWLGNNSYAVKSNKKKESGSIVWPDGETFFYKKFSVDSLLNKLINLFRDRAQRAFKMSLQLVRAGISVPCPAAIIKDMKQGSVYYICEELSNTRTLSSYVKAVNSPEKVENIMKRFAFEIADFHKAGFFHGDMNWKNIMIDADSESKSYYIDLDTAGKLSSARDTRYAMDLARFSIDIAEKTSGRDYISVFIMAYAGAAGVSCKTLIKSMKPYHRKIAAKHKTKYDSNIPSLTLNS